MDILLNTSYIDKIYSSSLEIIKEDRDQYKKIYEIIEEYCKEHSLIVSDPLYISETYEDNIQYYSKKYYNVYTLNPFLHSNNLANEIYKQMIHVDNNAKYTKLKTIREQEEFVIDYNFRPIISLYKSQKYKDKGDIIYPIAHPNGLLYMPPEIELIDIYHNIYTFSDYTKNIDLSNILYNLINKRRNKDRYNLNPIGSGGVTSGGDEWRLGGGNQCKQNRKNIVNIIKYKIMTELFKNNDDIIILGLWSTDFIKNKYNINCVNNEKVQVMSRWSSTILLNYIAEYFSKTFREIDKDNIYVKEQELMIPKDFRTKRYTYYIKINIQGRIIEKPILDLFNSCEFEIIPYNKVNGYNIPNIYVILRFMFVDLWIIKIIFSLKLITEDIYNMKISLIWDSIDFIIDSASNNTIETKLIELPTSLSNYMGVYIEYSISKKNASLQEKKFYPYYPYIYIRDNNEYRIISGGDE